LSLSGLHDVHRVCHPDRVPERSEGDGGLAHGHDIKSHTLAVQRTSDLLKGEKKRVETVARCKAIPSIGTHIKVGVWVDYRTKPVAPSTTFTNHHDDDGYGRGRKCGECAPRPYELVALST